MGLGKGGGGGGGGGDGEELYPRKGEILLNYLIHFIENIYKKNIVVFW